MAKLTLAVSLLASIAIQSAIADSCDLERPGAGPPGIDEFAFLIGDHEVALYAWRGDAWGPARPVAAHWNGRYALEGRAIVDEWLDPGWGQAPEVRGVTVRVRDASTGVWTMSWVSTSSDRVSDLRAEVRDGRLTMWQAHPERPGWKAEFRVLDADRWERVAYVRDDGGNWTPQFRLLATRRGCPPPVE